METTELLKILNYNAPEWSRYAAATVLEGSHIAPEYTYYEHEPEIVSNVNGTREYWKATSGRCKPRSGIPYTGNDWKISLIKLSGANNA